MPRPDESGDMSTGDPQESVESHLRKALSATEIEDKNYHVRQAIQLLQVSE